MTAPLVTVVTVCFNPGTLLKTTLESVQRQTARKEIEYLVIDGRSGDGTRELLQDGKKTGLVDDFVSEPDQGIYDAMSKGLALARGEWVLFLNAGDTFFADDTVSQIRLADRGDYDVAYGDCAQAFDGYEIVDKASPLENLPFQMIASHQSLFFRTAVHRLYSFDFRWRICADFDVVCRLASGGRKFLKLDLVVSRTPAEGFSGSQLKKNALEKEAIASRCFPNQARRIHAFYGRKRFLLPFKALAKTLLPAGWLRRRRENVLSVPR